MTKDSSSLQGGGADDTTHVSRKKKHPIDMAYYRAIEPSFAKEWLSPEDCAAYDTLLGGDKP